MAQRRALIQVRRAERGGRIKATLTLLQPCWGMVTRKRLRSILTALGLYLGAVLFIGYFGINAYTGDHGFKAKQDLDAQISELSGELAELKQARTQWERRLTLLRAHSLDPDMLDERARTLLGYSHPHDVVMPIKGN
jgi:cell division protein FtsB